MFPSTYCDTHNNYGMIRFASFIHTAPGRITSTARIKHWPFPLQLDTAKIRVSGKIGN